MTKKEFENHDEPLVMIVSLNPETGKVLYPTYDWRIADSIMNKMKRDFPDMLHFRTINKAGTNERLNQFSILLIKQNK